MTVATQHDSCASQVRPRLPLLGTASHTPGMFGPDASDGNGIHREKKQPPSVLVRRWVSEKKLRARSNCSTLEH